LPGWLQAGEGQAIAASVPSLVRHPDAPPGAIHSIDAELERLPGGAIAIFRVRGDMAKLVVPALAAPERSDGLWRTTCFELFVAGEGGGYREFNFSPSGQWAAYEFDDYRAGMRNALAEMETEVCRTNNALDFSVKVKAEFPNPVLVGLTAVIEEVDGAISYWSTAFAPGKPDFHAEAVRSLLFDGVSAE
jgi:hypothetical protein